MKIQETELYKLLSKPSQMVYWSNVNHLTAFLYIQASFHDMGAGYGVSKSAEALRECADKLVELYKLDE